MVCEPARESKIENYLGMFEVQGPENYGKFDLCHERMQFSNGTGRGVLMSDRR